MKFLAIAAALLLSPQRDMVTMRIEEVSDEEVWMTPYVPPTLNFRIESGYASPGTVRCQIEESVARHADHEDNLFVLVCEDARLVLRAIDLR